MFRIGLLFSCLIATFFAVPQSAGAGQAAPASIRVGRTCSCKTCTSVVTVSMETYTKRVLPQEWISSWGAESLKAGAIAIRSYGAWHVYSPISATFDVCDTTCCQKYGTSQYASTDAAVDATAGIYLLNIYGNIARSEYSAENNNTGCGDGSTGTCLSDSICAGTTGNGHGRGMCQWGSQRWSQQGKTYDWIVDHYFNQHSYFRANLTSAAGKNTIVVDNSSTGFTSSANWYATASSTDRYGADYKYRSTQAVSDAALWTTSITTAGTYTVSAIWSAGTNRSTTAPFILPNGTSVSTNQQANGGKWNTLGSCSLAAGNAVTKLSCWTASGYVVIADAVKLYGP